MALRGEMMVLTIIYLLIVLFFVVMIIWNLFETESLMEKLSGAIVLIMFILRLLLIK